MRKSSFSQTLFGLFFLIGLLLAPACRFGNEPAPAPAAKVTEVSKDRESHGLKLEFEDGAIKLPAKVEVYFRVRTADNKPVTTLQCRDITLYEDNEPVSIYESVYGVKATPETAKLSALLLLDLSGSIVKTSLDTLKQAAAAFVDTLFRPNHANNGNVELGIAIFDGRPKPVPLADFTTEAGKLLDAVTKISPSLSLDNSTNLNGAIEEGVKTVSARLKSNKALGLVPTGALVIFTDGKDRAGRVQATQTLKSVLDSGLKVYAIGLKGEIDEPVLEQLGRDGFFRVDFMLNLVDKFKQVASFVSDEARCRYRLEYCSPRRKGSHQVKIKVTNKDDHASFGSITVSFSADGFSGGCEIDAINRCEKDP